MEAGCVLFVEDVVSLGRAEPEPAKVAKDHWRRQQVDGLAAALTQAAAELAELEGTRNVEGRNKGLAAPADVGTVHRPAPAEVGGAGRKATRFRACATRRCRPAEALRSRAPDRSC